MTDSTMKKPADVPLENTTKVSVDWLKLDRENPRLLGVSARMSEESIVAQLYRGEELGELLQSIAANGYLARIMQRFDDIGGTLRGIG